MEGRTNLASSPPHIANIWICYMWSMQCLSYVVSGDSHTQRVSKVQICVRTSTLFLSGLIGAQFQERDIAWIAMDMSQSHRLAYVPSWFFPRKRRHDHRSHHSINMSVKRMHNQPLFQSWQRMGFSHTMLFMSPPRVLHELECFCSVVVRISIWVVHFADIDTHEQMRNFVVPFPHRRLHCWWLTWTVV